MSVASRPVTTGKTRTCPHCKATILESLSICPGCMHHLRFDSEAAKRQVAAAPALRVEGMIRHPPLEQPLEYFVIIAVRNDRGEEVTRQVVNVGALQAAEKRTFTLSVEVLPPQATSASKSTAATGTFKAPAPQPSATVRAPQPPPLSSPASTVKTPTPPGAPGPAGSSSPTGSPPSGSTAGSPPSGSIAGSQPGITRSGSSPPPAGQAGSARPQPPGSAPNAPKAPQTGYPGGLKPPNPGGPKRH